MDWSGFRNAAWPVPDRTKPELLAFISKFAPLAVVMLRLNAFTVPDESVRLADPTHPDAKVYVPVAVFDVDLPTDVVVYRAVTFPCPSNTIRPSSSWIPLTAPPAMVDPVMLNTNGPESVDVAQSCEAEAPFPE